jgi:hypothetical protein
MNGLGLEAGRLTHPFGSPACAGGQQEFYPNLGKDLKNGIDDRGLPGPGASGNHHYLVGYGHLYRFHLVGCQGDIQLLLYPGLDEDNSEQTREDELFARAVALTGIEEKTVLVGLGLEALIAWESAKRLAALGGLKGI